MAWTAYASTDASAPTLSGTVSSFINVLDAILVSGYGAKPAAGWSKPYTGTNKAVFYNGAGALARHYIRVLDDGTVPTSGAKECYVTGYATMSDVDTGTGNTTVVIVRKSTTADATARAWLAWADDRSLIFLNIAGDTSYTSFYYMSYFGEFWSYRTADAYAFCVAARSQGNDATGLYEMNTKWEVNTVSGALSNVVAYAVGSHNQVSGNTALYRYVSSAMVPVGQTSGIGGRLTYPNAADQGIWLQPMTLVGYDGAVITMRGKLRGAWFTLHPPTSFSGGATFSGGGELAGKTFQVVRNITHSGTAYNGALVVETTPPASSS